MHTLPPVLGILAYLLSTAVIAGNIAAMVNSETPRSPVLGRWLWLSGLGLHAFALYQGIFGSGGPNLEFFNALSAETWLMAALLLLATLKRPLDNLGIVMVPLAAVGIFLQLAFTDPQAHSTEASIGLDLHIFTSLLAYSLLSLAAVLAIILAVQNRHLHNHRPGGLLRALPPLQHMESLLFQVIALGFALLTGALISGFVYLEDIFAQHVVHKTVLSIAAWLIFAVLLWGRWRFGWRGRIAIRWTLGGFFALMLAFFGTKLVLELVLNR